MRKLFFVLIVGLCLAACSSPFGVYQDLANIPGVVPGEGDNNYNENTTYKGALLPWSARGREDMVDMLKLIGTQKGEIDDALFIESLNNKLFDPVLRYTCRKNYDGSPAEWDDKREMIGGPAFFTLWMHTDGWYTHKEGPYPYSDIPVDDEPIYNYISEELGIWGFISNHYYWEYDAEKNTLYTTVGGTTVAAEVIYLDGETAILEGFVIPMATCPPFSVTDAEIPMELYLFKFVDGKDGYYDNYVSSSEEYFELVEQYREVVENKNK